MCSRLAPGQPEIQHGKDLMSYGRIFTLGQWEACDWTGKREAELRVAETGGGGRKEDGDRLATGCCDIIKVRILR